MKFPLASRRDWTLAGLAALAPPLLAVSVWAVSTQFWTTATFEDFSKGTLAGISLNRDGSMMLAPRLEEAFNTEQAMVWAVARDSKGNLYLGTGHSGKVYRLGPDLKGTLVFDAEEPDIFALAVDRQDRLYIGTSPDGKIYRLDSLGNSSVFFEPGMAYIWAMTFAPDGSLFVGTGDRGRIFRVQPDGTGRLFYETNQTHVMSLAMDRSGELIAGTDPNGLIYRISEGGKAFVLYNAPDGEIHQISLGGDGSIYAAVIGRGNQGQFRQQFPQPSPDPGSAPATATITVRAADDPLQPPGQPGGPEGQPDQGQPQAGGGVPAAMAGRLPSMAGRPGQGRAQRSSIVRISPDSTVETLWSSATESAFDLRPSGNEILFSTDDKGRIYQLVNGQELSILTQTDQEQTTRLIPFGEATLLTTANLGKVFRMDTRPAASGSFESEVRDAGNISAWGQIRWRAEVPEGARLELFTRTGNSARPDATWSDWSAAYSKPDGEPIQSPPARFAQWKAVLYSSGERSPVLQEVSIAYLPRNRTPEITDLRATPRSNRSPQQGTVTAPGGGGPVRITASNQAFSGIAAAARQNSQPGVDISWVASDPDQDELTYTLYFRGEGETEWKLLQADLSQNYFQLNANTLPDGQYRVRVVASDAGQNPASMARSTDRVSPPFLVDFTAPTVAFTGTAPQPAVPGNTGPAIKLMFKAFDAASSLTRAEYALDSEPLQALLSEDGIVDSQQESFAIVISPEAGREHLVTLRVYDSAGNVGVGKAVLPPR